jgi:hypothetical protein
MCCLCSLIQNFDLGKHEIQTLCYIDVKFDNSDASKLLNDIVIVLDDHNFEKYKSIHNRYNKMKDCKSETIIPTLLNNLLKVVEYEKIDI